MRPEEAVRDVEFIKTLVAGTRRTSGEVAPWLLLWGIIWIVGFSLPLAGVKGAALGRAWMWLDLAGAAGSFLIGWRRGGPIPYVWKGILWSWAVLLAAALAAQAALPRVVRPDLLVRPDGLVYAVIWVLLPGLAYLQAGFFAGRDLALLGAWLITVAAAGLALPFPWSHALYAVAGGGGMLAAALLLRREGR